MSFYLSLEWKVLRYMALLHYGKKCLSCGSEDSELHVDHIKPISLFPELKEDVNNLQILCKKCNLDKSNIHTTDYRSEESKSKSFPHKPKVIKLPPVNNETKYVVYKEIQHIYKKGDTLCLLSKALKRKPFLRFLQRQDYSRKVCKNCLYLKKKQDFR
jgi:hypothetical protein